MSLCFKFKLKFTGEDVKTIEKKAFDIFNEIEQHFKPDTTSYNTLIAHFGSSETFRENFGNCEILKLMETKGLSPDLYTYNSCLKICEKTGDWKKAADLLREIQGSNNCIPDILSYSTAISACEKGNEWRAALELFNEAKRTLPKLDVVMCNAVISALEKGIFKGIFPLNPLEN